MLFPSGLKIVVVSFWWTLYGWYMVPTTLHMVQHQHMQGVTADWNVQLSLLCVGTAQLQPCIVTIQRMAHGAKIKFIHSLISGQLLGGHSLASLSLMLALSCCCSRHRFCPPPLPFLPRPPPHPPPPPIPHTQWTSMMSDCGQPSELKASFYPPRPPTVLRHFNLGQSQSHRNCSYRNSTKAPKHDT